MSRANPVAIISAAIPTAILVGMGVAHIVADHVAVSPRPPVRIVREVAPSAETRARHDERIVASIREADRRAEDEKARRKHDEFMAEIRLMDAEDEYRTLTGRAWNDGKVSPDCASVELAKVREAIRRAREARNAPRGAPAR